MDLARPAASLVGGADGTRGSTEHDTRYVAAQQAASGVLHALAKGAVINADLGILAHNDWAQRSTTTLRISHSSRISSEAPRVSLEKLHTEMLKAAVDAGDVADALGALPIIVPAFQYTGTGQRTRKYLIAWCCRAAGTDEAVVARLPVTEPPDASEALKPLVRRVRHMTNNPGTLTFEAVKLPQEILLVVSMNEGLRHALRAVLARTRVLSATGRAAPGPVRPRARPEPSDTEPPSHKDVPIQWWRALFPDTAEAPGHGFRGTGDRAAVHRAFHVILRPRPPTDDASVAEAHAQARSATLDAWLATTLGRLEVNPDVPVVLPSNLTVGVSANVVRYGAAPRTTELAEAFLRYIRVQQDGLLGTLLGSHAAAAEPAGVTAAAAVHRDGVSPWYPPIVAPHIDRLISVRRANERQLVEAASIEPPCALEGVPNTPSLLPIHVFGEGGLTHVRAHVAYHTGAVPRALTVPLHPPTTMSDCSVDIDGVAVNIRYLSGVARYHLCSAEQRVLHAAAAQHAQQQPVAGAPTLAGALASVVLAAAKRVSGYEPANLERAALALRSTAAAGRPAELALAASASILAPPPLKTDAQAAVKYVFGLAEAVGVGDLSDQLVSVPASGAVTLTDMKPTVDATFIAQRTCSMYLLPCTTGSSTEPVRIVTVGVTHEQAVAAVRDIVAAIVEKERISGGSTGSVRADGLAARGTHDRIAVGGGALVPLAILTLLLLRHSKEGRSAPFAFIKM